VAKPARRSLADLAAASPIQGAVAASQQSKEVVAAHPPADIPASPAQSSRMAKYPSATVYLPPRAIRLLKEIGLEENRRLTDILAEAIDEWLVRKGHPSLEQLGQ
jgi:hypothetical protein